jgi:hypothetical protein
VGITSGYINRKIEGNAIIDTEGQASGLEIVPGCIFGAVDIGELANAGNPNTPAILLRWRQRGRTTLALGPGYTGKTTPEIWRAAVQRKAGCAEASAACADVIHTPI